MQKVPVNIHSVTITSKKQYSQGWNVPFNSAMFINYDVNNSVYINSEIVISPALSITDNVGAKVIPAIFEMSLNSGEYNTSNFKIDFRAAANPNLVINWTEYE